MKISFVYPKFEKLTESWPELGILAKTSNLGNFRMPPALGIPILSALTPQEIEIEIFDGNIEPINYNTDSDLIAISFFTPQAEYAFEAAKNFKAAGKTVIAGGMHPSMMPEEVSQYVDSVCVGEAEAVWPQILKDFSEGKLKKVYQGGYPELDMMPVPKRSVFKNKNGYDWEATLVQVSRGCMHNCENCILPVEGGKPFRFRPVDKVIEDIESIQFREFFITDDPLVLPNKECTSYFTSLMKETAKLEPKPRIFLSGSLNMEIKPDYLKMLLDGGIVSVYVVLGCDPFSINAFRKGGQRFFDWSIDIIKKIQDSGLHAFTSHGFGFDYQDGSVFDRSLEFIEKAEVDTAEFYILTPFPKTPSWNKFQNEKRILHTNWTKYNTANVVFQPKNFSIEELTKGYIMCWQEHYKHKGLDNPVNIFTPPKK